MEQTLTRHSVAETIFIHGGKQASLEYAGIVMFSSNEMTGACGAVGKCEKGKPTPRRCGACPKNPANITQG